MTRALPTYRNAVTADWDEDRVEKLQSLWALGWSCSQIARAIGGGLTRCAIAGKVYRLRLAKRRTLVRDPTGWEKQAAATRKPVVPKIKSHSNITRAAAAPKAKRQVVVPRPVDGAKDADLVAQWLEANGGARRFQRGDSADYSAMTFFLRDRGYDVAYSQKGGRKVTIKRTGSMGRPRSMSFQELVEFVDSIRLEEGLEPIHPVEIEAEQMRNAA